MSESDGGFKAALEEAKIGAKEGGIPIGACLVDKDGKILGRGHNMRIQKDSAILHVCNTGSFYLQIFVLVVSDSSRAKHPL
jgi:tRNA(Arg) A34 adenosine deaminase TadA